MLKEFFYDWPLLKQIRDRKDGTGPEAMSERTRSLAPKTEGAQVARSICPYCGVGCGQLIFHKDGKLISIEGDPESPISGAGYARRAQTALSCSLIQQG